MLVRVRLALAQAADRDRIFTGLAGPHCHVLAQDVSQVPALVGESFDVAILDRATLATAPGMLTTLRALPDRPVLVVIDEVRDAHAQAALVAAGADAVLGRSPELLPALLAIVERRRQARLERHQASLRDRRQPMELVANSPGMKEVMETAHRVAYADSPVLVQGETGVGKERIASTIHSLGPRASGPFVSVNCAALPAELFESELFGHAKGAFTGAHRAHRGQFEQADRGVLLLDEIGEVPLPLQAKLLRAIQDQRIRPVGADETIEVDVRIVAATNRDLEAEVAAGRFRQDLYYRLCVIEIVVPPLRERTEDIVALADAYLGLQRRQQGREVTGLSDAAREALTRYPWPGNVRELANVVERAVLLCRGAIVQLEDLPVAIARYADQAEADLEVDPEVDAAVEELARAGSIELPGEWAQHGWKQVRAALLLDGEREYLTTLLQQSHGRVGEVARRAGISARALFDKMRRHGLRKEDFRPVRAPHD